jgi:ribosomal protein L14
MIGVLSMFKVVDNTGALNVQCIRILDNIKKRKAKIGDKIVVVIKTAKPHNEKIKVGKIK